MNAGQLEQVNEITRLMDEMHRHYWSTSKDAHGKSDDGWVEVLLGTSRIREEGLNEVNVELSHSVFVPGRRKLYSSPYMALREVKEWHDEEMKNDHKDEGFFS